MRPAKRRDVGRGERVLDGLWRLRLPLPWPGIPQVNAWAIAAGDGIVLVDTGIHAEGSLAQIERALGDCGLALGDVRLLICTHAHVDHYGEAAAIVERTGCPFWMHPSHRHLTATADDPGASLRRRMEAARASGVPPRELELLAQHRRGDVSELSGIVLPTTELVDGVTVETDLGTWVAYETPGHAPSHVCLYQAEHRLLLSGDHLIGRAVLFFDQGFTPNPAGEYLRSLDVIERLDARLALPGHGRTFADVGRHIEINRTVIRERVAAVLAAVTARDAASAFDIVPRVFEGELSSVTIAWWLNEVLAYLTHLETMGAVVREFDGKQERWRATGI